MNASKRALAAVAMVLALAGSACTAGHRIVGGSVLPNVSPAGTPMTYVAIGASETVGIGAADPVTEGWAYVFYRTALQRAATFVNLAISRATTEDALQRELPEAVKVHPDLVTVWLGGNDILHGVSPQTYGQELTTLLEKLRGAKILVANLPSLQDVPRFAGLGGLAATVEAYDEAVARAARAVGATIVDLTPLAAQLIRQGRVSDLISSDGLHPNAAGYAAIARVFAAAYASAT